jgi:trimethylamine:corrinoid methyltransferase-like protein
MPSLGANTPLNLVAAYAQTLAETVGGAIVYEALTGVQASYGTNIITFDFYDTSMPFGTPEKLLLEWANMEVGARVGGGEYSGKVWFTDIHTNAPRCGIQACVEKASLTMAGALMGATGFYTAGTLGMDELFSPVQLLLDMEMLAHTQKIVNGMPNDNFDGDLIAEIREGLENGYVMSDRTLDNMSDYVWRANFFARRTFGAYTNKPFTAEIEKAREKAQTIMNMPPAWKISDELESEAERIFEAAKKQI